MQNVQRTIDLLLSRGATFEVRTTVIPQHGMEDLVRIARELPIVPLYSLSRYRRPEKYPLDYEIFISEKPYSEDKLCEFADALREWQPNIRA